MKTTGIVFIVAALFALVKCSNKSDHSTILYPDPKPDTVALPFLPGIVSSDSLDFNLTFSQDGKTIYFSRSKHGKWLILQSSFDGHNWSLPTIAPFSEDQYSQADPFVSLDGSMYYISNRPRNTYDTIPDFDIWFVRPLGHNKWSKPINVEGVNSDSTEYYVSLADNGNLYFASNRVGGYGGLDIYVSKLVNGEYSVPENLGPYINTLADEHDPLIIGHEEFIIFNSSRTDSYGEADLYYSSKRHDGAWGNSKHMGALFNTPTYEYCPNLSPDRKYFFFSSEFDIKWISSDKLPFKISD
ncbi:MAG: PD40 domain-containing protein [Cyclobacteriaceae bacterium]|nr:PD40 domain-containing protein [Cyclobacteriaceae bacterium]